LTAAPWTLLSVAIGSVELVFQNSTVVRRNGIWYPCAIAGNKFACSDVVHIIVLRFGLALLESWQSLYLFC